MSRAEIVGYSVTGALALVALYTGASFAAGLAGQPRPCVIPVWVPLVMVIAVTYLLKRRPPRKRDAVDDLIDDFMSQD